jgi:hypothetical protein
LDALFSRREFGFLERVTIRIEPAGSHRLGIESADLAWDNEEASRIERLMRDVFSLLEKSKRLKVLIPEEYVV